MMGQALDKEEDGGGSNNNNNYNTYFVYSAINLDIIHSEVLKIHIR